MTSPAARRALCALCLFLASQPAPGQEGVLRAGAARADITPAQPCMLAGYASRTNLSTGVHDPLSARAVAFEHEGRRLVLVSTDIIGFYKGMAEHMRRTIIEACKLEPAELMLAAIHTHSAPTPTLEQGKIHPNNVEYTTALRNHLVTVTRESLARLQPATIGVGAGASPVGINRRESVKDPSGKTQIRLGRNPGGDTDPEVQVMQIRERAGGRVSAVLFAYATHSTSLGARNLIVSGDVHGLAEQFVEKHLGEGIIAPAFAGASGDIDPWFRVRPEIRTGRGWIPEPALLGAMLGEEVVLTSEGIRESTGDGPIRSLLKTIELPAKQDGDNPTPGAPATVPMTLAVGRVGEWAVVGLGGEVFHSIGRAIKAASPFRHTFVITHCNGGAGYLVVKEAYAEGGYEVKTSPFAPEAADRVIAEAAGLLRQLKAD